MVCVQYIMHSMSFPVSLSSMSTKESALTKTLFFHMSKYQIKFSCKT